MLPISLRPLFASIALLASLEAVGADPQAGRQLVEASCQNANCHGSEIYTRAERRVGNLDQLKTQIHRCEQNLGLRWFDEDVDNVAAYLDREYYRFH
jgi:hypothetical protein